MMTTSVPEQDRANLQAFLARDHARLDALFERLLSAFHADADGELGRLWAEFDSRLRAHLALEEQHMMPAFVLVDPAEARALADEHVRIRKLLSELDIAVDLHLAREETIDELIALLRAHAKREDALMYRWASSHLEPAKQRSLLEDPRCALGKLVGKE